VLPIGAPELQTGALIPVLNAAAFLMLTVAHTANDEIINNITQPSLEPLPFIWTVSSLLVY
jgi:hypothetical protein